MRQKQLSQIDAIINDQLQRDIAGIEASRKVYSALFLCSPITFFEITC